MLELTMGAEEPAEDASHSILLGSGHGIDHVGIAVRDLETAKKTYRDVLGFRTKTEGGVVAKFLEKHEGSLFLGLDVSPVDDTAKLLRTRGSTSKDPKAARETSIPTNTNYLTSL